MENKSIPIIAMVVLSILLLFTFDIQKAFALTIITVSSDNTPDSMAYVPEVNRYVTVNSGAVRVFNAELYTLAGSYSLAIGIDDVTCNNGICYGVDNGGADNEQFIFGFNPSTGAIVSNATFNFGSGAYSAIDDMTGGTNSVIAFDGKVYAYALCDNGNAVMVVAQGSSAVGLLGDCSGTHFGTGTSLGLVGFDNKIAITTDSASVNGFQIWLTSGGRVCQGASFTAGTAGHLAYSETTDKIYRTTASSQNVDIMNVDTCADEGNISSANSGLTTVLRGIQVNDDREEIYIQSTTTVAVMDLNTPTSLLYSFSSGGDTGTARFKTAVGEDLQQYATVYSNSLEIVQLDPIEPSTGNTGGIDCNLPENANILICRLGGDGTLGSAGSFVIGNTTEGTGLLGIGCGIGLVDCTSDPNPQTNGLGLLIFIASIFIVVGMFIRTEGLQETTKLPVYMWAMIIIALSAFFTITQIIDPVFLIISIIGLIALGAPKIVNTLKGGSTFGSGSTE